MMVIVVVVVLMLMIQGQTALHLAVQQGNLDVIGLLAEKGANVDFLYQVISSFLFKDSPMHSHSLYTHIVGLLAAYEGLRAGKP